MRGLDVSVTVCMRLSASATEASSSVDSSIANTPDTDESPDVSHIFMILISINAVFFLNFSLSNFRLIVHYSFTLSKLTCSMVNFNSNTNAPYRTGCLIKAACLVGIEQVGSSVVKTCCEDDSFKSFWF